MTKRGSPKERFFARAQNDNAFRRIHRRPSAFIGGLLIFDFGFSNVKEFGCGSATLWALRPLFDRKETFTLSLIWTVASGK
jgi:hypothetical protein